MSEGTFSDIAAYSSFPEKSLSREMQAFPCLSLLVMMLVADRIVQSLAHVQELDTLNKDYSSSRG